MNINVTLSDEFAGDAEFEFLEKLSGASRTFDAPAIHAQAAKGKIPAARAIEQREAVRREREMKQRLYDLKVKAELIRFIQAVNARLEPSAPLRPYVEPGRVAEYGQLVRRSNGQ